MPLGLWYIFMFYFITESFSLDTSGKTTSLATSIFFDSFETGCWYLIILDWQQYQNVSVFSNEKCSLTTLLILPSHGVSITFFSLKSFFSFFSDGFNNQLDLFLFQPIKYQPHRMIKHTQKIYWLLQTNFLSAFDHFAGLGLNGVINLWGYNLTRPSLMLLSSFHLVSEFLAIFGPFSGCCECWLLCVRLSLQYERYW